MLFAEVILVGIPNPTHRALQEGKRWYNGDAVFIKGVWVGRCETSDEHIVFTLGGRVLSRTIRRLEPTRRHDARFPSVVKGLPWVHKMASSEVGRERNQHRHISSFSVGESTQKHNTGIHDITDELGGRHSAGGHSGSGEETDDRNEVPMNESLPSDGQSQSSGGRTIEAIASQRQPQPTPMECDKV